MRKSRHVASSSFSRDKSRRLGYSQLEMASTRAHLTTRVLAQSPLPFALDPQRHSDVLERLPASRLLPSVRGEHGRGNSLHICNTNR